MIGSIADVARTLLVVAGRAGEQHTQTARGRYSRFIFCNANFAPLYEAAINITYDTNKKYPILFSFNNFPRFSLPP